MGQTLTEAEWREKDLRFERVMRRKGYIIKPMGEDGACLFRYKTISICPFISRVSTSKMMIYDIVAGLLLISCMVIKRCTPVCGRSAWTTYR